MVQKIEFNKKIESYCCSNPNCKTNFSHPKILKYYICPKCQSLVEMEGVTSQPVIEEISSDEEFFPGDFQSIKDKLTKEIEELNIKIKNNLKEIKELKIKNCNLNKKFGDMENKLHSTKHQLSLANSKLGLKYKELSQISEKNLDLSKRVESLETEIATGKTKVYEYTEKSIQDTKKITELESELKKLKTEKETLNLKTQKIEELEKKLSENDIYAKNLDQSLDELKEQIKKLKEQKEKALKQKNEAIEKQAKTENQINQEIETRTKLQNELVDLKEKMANAIRKESKTAEKSIQDTKKITELESELKKLKTEKETLNLKTQRSNDIKSQSGVNWIRDINLTEVKNVKKENIEIINDANVPKNPYLRIIEKDKKEGTELKSSSGCSFYLGYLSERDKGETIPSSCIECSKSLECMLSKVHKSNKSVKEIKKWYRLK